MNSPRRGGLSGRLAAAAAMLSTMAYFLGITHPSLHVYFSPDDLMNLYRAWFSPLGALVKANLLFFLNSPFGRPMGALWYRAIFYLVGFNPFWFHVVYLAILIVNIMLTYALAYHLSGKRTVAAITALLFAYTPRMVAVYFDTGFIYDVLCYCFYASALLLYVRVRSRNRLLTGRQVAAIFGLYVCALNSKEMAVTLPLLLGIYEWLYHPSPSWRRKDLCVWARCQAWMVASVAVVTLVFAIGRGSGSDSVVHHSAYRPLFTWGRFMETSRHFFKDAPAWQVLLLWGGLFLVAWLAKSRGLRFAVLFLFLSPIPVAFIAPREAAQYYVCWFGWSLYGAIVCASVARHLTPGAWRDHHGITTIRGAALLATLVFVCYPRYKREGWDSVLGVSLLGPENRDCVEQIHRLVPHLASNTRILFLNDPVRADWYNLLFMVRLSYRDRSLEVDRIKQPPTAPENTYDYVFDYRERRFLDVKRLSGEWHAATYSITFDLNKATL